MVGLTEVEVLPEFTRSTFVRTPDRWRCRLFGWFMRLVRTEKFSLEDLGCLMTAIYVDFHSQGSAASSLPRGLATLFQIRAIGLRDFLAVTHLRFLFGLSTLVFIRSVSPPAGLGRIDTLLEGVLRSGGSSKTSVDICG